MSGILAYLALREHPILADGTGDVWHNSMVGGLYEAHPPADLLDHQKLRHGFAWYIRPCPVQQA